MANDSPHLGNEIDGHKSNLNKWISDVEALDVSASHKGVNDRFVRDCRTALQDLDNTESPSAADLCDFDDSTNSLEVRYHQITDPNQ